MEFCERAYIDSVHVAHLLAVHRRDQAEAAVLLERLANYRSIISQIGRVLVRTESTIIEHTVARHARAAPEAITA